MSEETLRLVKVRHAPQRDVNQPVYMAATITVLDAGGRPHTLHFGGELKDGETEADLRKRLICGLADSIGLEIRKEVGNG